MPTDSYKSKCAKRKELDPMVQCLILFDFRHVHVVEIECSDRRGLVTKGKPGNAQ